MKFIAKLAVLTVFVSGMAFAKSPFVKTSMESIVLHDVEDVVIIKLSSEITNNEKCTKNDELVLKKDTHNMFQETYSALLASFHSGTKIAGVVSGCHQWGQPILVRLDIVK